MLLCLISMLYCLDVRNYVRDRANARRFGALGLVRRYQSTPDLHTYVAPPVAPPVASPPSYKSVQSHPAHHDYYNEEV